MEGFGGRPRRGTVHGEVWRVQDRRSKGNSRRKKERLELRSKAKEEKHLRDIPGIEGRYWNESASARPDGLREKAETAIWCRGTGPTRKKKEIYQ